ncbi:MAG TPA: hypothetical protein VIT44_18975 [Cyclobacteriaceae bacterium]
MRNRFIVGVTVMLVTIMVMVWIYFDKNEKRITIISTSKSLLGTETICSDKRIVNSVPSLVPQ